jgi:DNA-binding Lrp family transcriptional regulator
MLLNKNMFSIIAEFSSDYSKRLYGRQLAKKLNMNQKTVSNILNMLEKEHIVKYSTEGKNKYYFLNKLNTQLPDYIKIVEIERKNQFIAKYSKLKDLFKDLERKTNGIIIIYGSYANFTNNSQSDLDVFVMGEIEEIEDLENKYNLKINVVKSTKANFNINEVFVKEIINNHIILKGVEEFVGLLLD